MVQRRDRGRRLWMVLGLAIAGVLFAGGLAFAASQTIVGQVDNTYAGGTAGVFTADQGEVVQFSVTGSTHTVTAHQIGPDGKALFRTPTISGGTTGVAGTQYLSAGDYTFFCTVHPSTMQATLHVTSNGTPQARPRAALSLKSKSLAKAIKKGLQVGVNTSTRIDDLSLTAKLGKATIGKATVSLAAGQQLDVIKLSKSGKSRLRGKSKASITVTADVPFGLPASVTAKLS